MADTGTEPTALDVLRAARRIVEDGGDTDPCELGAYCLRCCIGIAKGSVDKRFSTPYCGGGVFVDNPTGRSPFVAYDTDRPLLEARDAIGKYDMGTVHTRQSALDVIDKAISDITNKA